jgi:hypothetical protein
MEEKMMTVQKIREYAEEKRKATIERDEAQNGKWMKLAADTLNELPEIEGVSEKQIAFADDLRKKFIIDMAHDNVCGFAANEVTDEEYKGYVNQLKQVNDAKTLIDGIPH